MHASTEWNGIRALWYEGAMYKGQKTKVFAMIGYPEMKEGEKVPAVVLVHGGGGHPYAEWIRRWNEKGFADEECYVSTSAWCEKRLKK